MDSDMIDNLLAQTPMAASLDRAYAVECINVPQLSASAAEDLSAIAPNVPNLGARHEAILQRAVHLSTRL
jgi:hypothetical protein